MPERIQETKYEHAKEGAEAKETTATAEVNPEIRAHAEEVLGETDALLDEIEHILENEEFLRNYVQKGGQ